MRDPKLSINHFGIDHLPITAVLDLAAEAGFTGIGLSARVVRQLGADDVSGKLQAAGLVATSVCVSAATLTCKPYLLWRDLAGVLEDAELASALGAPLVVMLGHELGAGRAQLAAVGQAFEQLTRHPQCRAQFLFEPVNSVLTALSCVNSLRDGKHLLAMAPRLRFVLDIWHSWRDPEIADVLPDLVARCAIVHVSDYSYHAADPMAREYPGNGVIDFGPLIHILQDNEFDGWWETEVLLPVRPEMGDLARYVRNCRDSLETFLSAAQPGRSGINQQG
jgi:sugar phosphate isomerase/epimerase